MGATSNVKIGLGGIGFSKAASTLKKLAVIVSDIRWKDQGGRRSDCFSRNYGKG